MRRVLLLAAALLPLCGLFAEVLSESAGAVVFRQPDGKAVTLRKKPERVVACYASFVQVWYAAGGKVVGIPLVRSRQALPEAARKLPVVGGLTTPNPEKVLALKPDLVLLLDKFEKHRAVSEVLNRAGVETVLLECGNYTDFSGLLDLFCRLNGTTVAAHPEG